MNKYVADTMAIVLYLEKRKLPNTVKDIFNNALQGDTTVSLSAISIMEIAYLFEKQRIDTSADDVIFFANENKNFVIHDLDSDVIIEAFKIKDIPELHDRLITGTASFINATLITNDPIIQKSTSIITTW